MNSYKINLVTIVGVYENLIEYIVHADNVLDAVRILTEKTEYNADEIISIHLIENSGYQVEVLAP